MVGPGGNPHTILRLWRISCDLPVAVWGKITKSLTRARMTLPIVDTDSGSRGVHHARQSLKELPLRKGSHGTIAGQQYHDGPRVFAVDGNRRGDALPANAVIT